MSRFVNVLLVLVIVGLLGFIALRPSGEGGAAGTAASAPASSSGKRKILYYKDPMHPWLTSPRPGKAPDCGMDMVPVYEGEEDESNPNAIKIDPVMQQNIGVRTALAKKRILTHRIRTTGRVTYDERLIRHIHTKISGWVEKLYVDFEGKFVRKGEPLLDIYSPELVSTQEEYLLALRAADLYRKSPDPAAREQGEALLRSARERLEYWDISEDEIARLEETRRPRKTLTLYSELDGIVVKRNTYEGQHVTPKKNLFMIADISRVWILADIYEYELPWIRVEKKAVVELPHLGKRLTGRISYIDPYLNPKTRTATIRLEFDNPGFTMKPDMYVNVLIDAGDERRVVTVPEEAVINTGRRKVVVVALGNGKFESRDVELGKRGDDFIEVRKGLREGEKVVTSAQFLIDSESQLKLGMAKMSHDMSAMDGKKKKEEKGSGKEPASQPAAGGTDAKEKKKKTSSAPPASQPAVDHSSMSGMDQASISGTREGMSGMDQSGMSGTSMEGGTMKMPPAAPASQPSVSPQEGTRGHER
ncbi:MAG: efflux RND transporter periplasmic adaptor subunit [Candidatus Hydrogenedentota bacterium]|nr:MAG: efflux RND transporter periplasmic adaptor subunit [Candidatus Hydrogenedentota bacterium]